MAATETRKELSEQLAESCRSTLQACFIEGYNYGIEKAYELLELHLSRCVECYVDDEVTTRLKEDVLGDFKKAMEE